MNLENDLIELEKKYGGLTTNVSRNEISSHSDPVSLPDFMKGGDRMSSDINCHGYAYYYAHYIKSKFKGASPKIIVECGILTGIGLAIWADLFPNARIIGFDIDLSNYESNKDNLIKNGAFQNNTPEVYQFDQFKDNKKYLKEILAGNKIDFFIDDGFHTGESIISTFASISPFLSDQFLYIIEDNYLTSYYLKSKIKQRLKFLLLIRCEFFISV